MTSWEGRSARLIWRIPILGMPTTAFYILWNAAIGKMLPPWAMIGGIDAIIPASRPGAGAGIFLRAETVALRDTTATMTIPGSLLSECGEEKLWIV